MSTLKQCEAVPAGESNLLEKYNIIFGRRLIKLHEASCCTLNQGCPFRHFSLASAAECQKYKLIWDHIKCCSTGSACQYPGCASSKFVLSHFRACKASHCSICKPLQNMLKGKQRKRRPGRISLSEINDAEQRMLISPNTAARKSAKEIIALQQQYRAMRKARRRSNAIVAAAQTRALQRGLPNVPLFHTTSQPTTPQPTTPQRKPFAAVVSKV
jgi:hypothetical protein